MVVSWLIFPFGLTTYHAIDTNEDADHHYLMFSATFNKDLRALARNYLATDFIRVRIGRAGSTHTNVTQQVSPTVPCKVQRLILLLRSSTLIGT